MFFPMLNTGTKITPLSLYCQEKLGIDNQWKPEWLVLQESWDWGSEDCIFLWREGMDFKDGVGLVWDK